MPLVYWRRFDVFGVLSGKMLWLRRFEYGHFLAPFCAGWVLILYSVQKRRTPRLSAGSMRQGDSWTLFHYLISLAFSGGWRSALKSDSGFSSGGSRVKRTPPRVEDGQGEAVVV